MAKCKSLLDFVNSIAGLLADKENITYTQDDVIRALNITIDAVAAARPDAYTETQTVKFVPGSDQKLPEGTLAIVGDMSNSCVDKNGVPINVPVSPVQAYVIRAYQFYNDKRCSSSDSQYQTGSTCSKWLMTGYFHDVRSPTDLRVTPPVPEGVTPTIKVTIQKAPPCFSATAMDDQLPDRYLAPITEFVLYLLLGIQWESESALRASIEHRNTFFTLLNYKYRQDSRFAGGYYLGQMGGAKSDPNVIRGQ